MLKTVDNVPHLIWGGIGEEAVRDDDRTDDLNITSALKVCLDYIDSAHSKVYIAGTSASAFYVGWRADSLMSGMGGSVYQFPRDEEPGLANLFKAIGRGFRLIKKGNDRDLWEGVTASIDLGRPVFAVEWNPVAHRGHSAIICGYDGVNESFRGRIFEFVKSREYAVIKPEDLHYVIIIGDKNAEAPSAHESAMGAIDIACQMSVAGLMEDEEAWILGLDAYSNHARMIAEQMITDDGSQYPMKEHFLFWQLEILHICRCYAHEYLRSILDVFESNEAAFISNAMNSFDEYINHFNRSLRIIFGEEAEEYGTSLLWSENNEEIPIRALFSTPGGRRTFADFLLQLRAYEENAYDCLRKAIQ